MPVNRNAKSRFADSAAKANISRQTKEQVEQAVKSICKCLTETVLCSMVPTSKYVSPVAVAEINFTPTTVQFFVHARPEANTPEFTCFCPAEKSSQLRLEFPTLNVELTYDDLTSEDTLKSSTEQIKDAASGLWADHIERWNAVAVEFNK
jgi:hypothetical protein